jgi:hypothetical protein
MRRERIILIIALAWSALATWNCRRYEHDLTTAMRDISAASAELGESRACCRILDAQH